MVDTQRVHLLGYRRYEFSNHLGNVLAVTSDRKILIDSAHTFLYYEADIYSLTDYYPFGMQMTGRTASLYVDTATGEKSVLMDYGISVSCSTCVKVDAYRYGFNGQQKDDEWKGEGNSLNYKFRSYDPRIGRFFAVDPIARDYPFWTPYQFAGNIPIKFLDLEGLQPGERAARAGIALGMGKEAVDAYDKGREATHEVGLQLLVDLSGVEDVYGVFAGERFDGTEYSRYKAGGWVAVGMIPGVRLLKAGKGVYRTAKAVNSVNKVAKLAHKAKQVGLVKTSRIAAANPGTIRKLNGTFKTVSESMSANSKSFQEFVTGRAWNTSYVMNGVKFDGQIRGILIDAKAGMKNFVNPKTGEFHRFFTGAQGMVDQAMRQKKAADGAPIRWVFQEESAMNATKKLFDREGIRHIELMHVEKKID